MKKIFLFITLFLLLLLLTFLIYTEIPYSGCLNYKPAKESEFLRVIDELSEENTREYLLKRNLVGGYTWKDFEYSPYDFTDYDQSQKAYTILLMQHTSIREHLYLAKIANQSYGQKILTDKEALINLFYSPDLHGTGTNAKYRWLPAWRREFGKYAEKMLTGEQLKIINKRLFFSEW